MPSPSVYFEDVQVGMKFTSEHSKPITLEQCVKHADNTDDRVHKPITLKGQTEPKVVVQGNLVTAITGGLLFREGHFNETCVHQAEKRVKFVNPAFVGDSIYAVEEVIEVEDQPGKSSGRVILARKTFNASGQLIQDVWQDYRIRKRG